MRRLEARLVGTRTDAMRHLIEPVAQRLGADFDRLKQNVVFWVARHTLILWLCSGFIWERLAPLGEGLVSYSRSNGAGQVTAAPTERVGEGRGVREHSEINSMSV